MVCSEGLVQAGQYQSMSDRRIAPAIVRYRSN
jgi:hypothetical protein